MVTLKLKDDSIPKLSRKTSPKRSCEKCGEELECTTCTMNNEDIVMFQKVLYKPQPFEDNYVDSRTFLNSMVTNGVYHSLLAPLSLLMLFCQISENVRPFHYWSMVHDSCGIIQEPTLLTKPPHSWLIASPLF